MKIRMLMSVGVFHGHIDVKRGDVVEVDDFNAHRYIQLGYARPHVEIVPDDFDSAPPIEVAVPCDDDVEVSDREFPAPLDDGEDEPSEPVEAVRPRRARKP